MRDFPFFTTDYGVASLLLKEIPYKKQAYICVRDVQHDGLEQHLQECVGFCKMAGAEHIYADGHEELDRYPLYTSVLKMRGQVNIIPEELAQLFPVTEQTVGRWREIHNQKMRDVDNAGTLEKRDEKRILESGGAYFIHENGKLLGIGWLEKNNILAIAGAVPGAGERIMKTMLSLQEGETITLEVASTNLRAIRLYEKLGFVVVEEISRWYQIM
jgi:RimJ/RimL family protein N-acetyltransferase